jgi:hypothetical protein
MAELFQRKCSVSIVSFTEDATGKKVIIDEKKIENLRIAFNVEKSAKKEPNKALIQIANLSKDTRSFIDKNNLLVVLNAGYRDQFASIFSGTTYRINHKTDKADIITTIECADGGENVKKKVGAWSFGKGASTAAVVNTLATALGLPVSTGSTIEPNKQSFRNGWAFVGTASAGLDLACDAVGLRWSIQDGQILILKKDTEGDGTIDILLSATTGMIGAIEEGEADQKTKIRKFSVKCLINPLIKPDKTVKVESQYTPKLNGRYRVQGVKIAGDTHGADWTMQIDLRLL